MTLKKRQELRQEGFERIDDNLNFLIGCLTDALHALGEDELVRYMPWSGSVPEAAPPEGLQQLYSIGFQLLNMVEERVAASIRREREKELGGESIRGLWPRALKDMQAIGLSAEGIMEVLSEVDVQPVLTAHPTEAKRGSVRERHRALYDSLVRFEYRKYTERERRRMREQIVASLETLWRTGEIHLVRPDVFRELRDAIHYLRDLFPIALDRLDLHFTEAWRDAGFPLEQLRSAGNIPNLTFGTWIGGDRDGHPLVTPEVTRKALGMLRAGALQRIHSELTELATLLTLSRNQNAIPIELDTRIDELSSALGEEAKTKELQARFQEEPWRHLVLLMAARVERQIQGHAGYSSPASLMEDIDLLSKTIRDCGCTLLEEQYLRPFRHKLEVFGFHLATLDIRQNSEFHDQAISQLLVAAGIEGGEDYASWGEEKRVEFLSRELESPRPFLHDSARAGEQADLVLDAYRVLLEHRREHENRGLGALIVSMTRQLSDLLGVFLLAREAGLTVVKNGGLTCPLEVVPLFETMDDLERAPGILSDFLEHPVVRRNGSGSQQVMLGYSDSNKDCGILSASWTLHRAQEELSEVGRRHQIKLRFFHGRGGTISRGAGPTHWFMAALPHGSLSGGFRMTEQGETIAQKYANLANATYHLELILAGAACTTANHSQPTSKVDPADALFPAISEASEKAYRELLHADGFIDFYRQVTPIDALENSRIGSRPARRTGKKGHSIADLRAIPWVFSWTQARFYLPGWYGVGTALTELRQDYPDYFKGLKAAIPESNFLSYTFTNVETNLASANLELMGEYAGLVEDKALRRRFMDRIVLEFHRTHECVSELLNGDMHQRRPRMAKTLDIREEPLDVLHRQQVDLLKTWRSHLAAGREKEAEDLFPRLLLSINAISSGLRTTG